MRSITGLKIFLAIIGDFYKLSEFEFAKDFERYWLVKTEAALQRGSWEKVF